MKKLFTTLGIFVVVASGAHVNAQHPTMPTGMSHEDHLRELKKDDQLKRRGAIAMGFDQDKTIHHFLPLTTGGAIEVTSKDAGDVESIAQIRTHVRDIVVAFGRGEFDKPLAIHGELPPGAETMASSKANISYRYEERANGGAVVIETSDSVALKAIHDFLQYQTVEHKTSDSPIANPTLGILRGFPNF
jgi:hypothetical protein